MADELGVARRRARRRGRAAAGRRARRDRRRRPRSSRFALEPASRRRSGGAPPALGARAGRPAPRLPSSARRPSVALLSDRLNQDPFLGDAVHGMLSKVTRDPLGVPRSWPGRRRRSTPRSAERFVADRSPTTAGVSSDVAQALAGFFDAARSAGRGRSRRSRRSTTSSPSTTTTSRRSRPPPRRWFATPAWARCRPTPRSSSTSRRRARRHGAQRRGAGGAVGPSRPHAARFEADAGTLELLDTAAARDPSLPAGAPGRRARRGRADRRDARGRPVLESDAARRRAVHALASYVAAALLLPYDAVHAAAVAARYDIEHLRAALRRQLRAGLPPPGHAAPPRAARACASASCASTRPATSPSATRCPACRCRATAPPARCGRSTPRSRRRGRWCASSPSSPAASGACWWRARSRRPRPMRAAPRRLVSVMLMCDVLHADAWSTPTGSTCRRQRPATPVGPTCRICVRARLRLPAGRSDHRRGHRRGCTARDPDDSRQARIGSGPGGR